MQLSIKQMKPNNKAAILKYNLNLKDISNFTCV
jgi:hypothetical protein